MELEQIVQLKKQQKNKIELGDYVTLGKLLNVAQDTARKRYYRDNEEAVLVMQEIIDSREGLIKKFKKK